MLSSPRTLGNAPMPKTWTDYYLHDSAYLNGN